MPAAVQDFGAHINVEYCHSAKSIKYICKYVNKGSDAAVFGIRRYNCVDEVTDYVAGPQAFWRIFGFPIHQRAPAIVKPCCSLRKWTEDVLHRTKRPAGCKKP